MNEMVVDTLPKALVRMVGQDPARVALREKHLGLWKDISWAEYPGKSQSRGPGAA